MSVTLEQIRQLIREEMERSNKPSKENKTLVDDDIVKHVLDCPNCYSKVIQGTEAICKDCKSPLGKIETAKKLDKCPWCGKNHGYTKVPYEDRLLNAVRR